MVSDQTCSKISCSNFNIKVNNEKAQSQFIEQTNGLQIQEEYLKERGNYVFVQTGYDCTEKGFTS